MKAAVARKPVIKIAVVESDPLRFVGFRALFDSEPEFELVSVEFVADHAVPAGSLRDVTLRPFKPKAFRASRPKIASINTTEVCNLSCVMCHFNGPNAIKKAGALDPSQVEKVLREALTKGEF